MTIDRLNIARNWRLLQSQKLPIQLGMPPKPVTYALDYSPSIGQIAMESALVRGVLRVHPEHHDQRGFVNSLTPMQQAIYARMR